MRFLVLVAATMIGCAPATPPAAAPVPVSAPPVEIAPADERAPAETPSEPDPEPVDEKPEVPEPNALLDAVAPCDDDCEGFGAGGLGLRGVGQGGGGIGVGGIGSIGGGAGRGPGYGKGSGRMGRVGRGEATTSGRLPKEVIGRIVRNNLGRVRFCYEQALLREPNREGKVTVLFVIGTEGAVTSTKIDSSDVDDPELERCVTDVFDKMAFPKPEGGIVTVRYPLVFTPSP